MVSGHGGPLAIKKNHSSKKSRRAPKAILRLPDLDHAKTAVLNSLNCTEAQRGYRHAIDEFVDWYCSEPRLAFNKTVVLGIVFISNPGNSHPGRSIYDSGPYVGLPMKHRTADSSVRIWRLAFVGSKA